MNTTERRRRNRRKPCHAVAMHRARMARRQGRNRLIVMLVFLWAVLSGPFRSSPFASFPTHGSSPVPRPSRRLESQDWPVTDYERGEGNHLIKPRLARSRGTGRYRSRPSLSRLMADLRRPAARKDATLALLAHIADPETQAWAAERIVKGEINRLSIWVQAASTEETVMAAWGGEAEAALADAEIAAATPSSDRESLLQAAKLLELIAGTESGTSTGPRRPGNC